MPAATTVCTLPFAVGNGGCCCLSFPFCAEFLDFRRSRCWVPSVDELLCSALFSSQPSSFQPALHDASFDFR
uniref:Putative secreted protein n=1 Tax=Anopheles darlingi TaxID=43151 RepID=A0A2M4D7I4_ANODA